MSGIGCVLKANNRSFLTLSLQNNIADNVPLLMMKCILPLLNFLKYLEDRI